MSHEATYFILKIVQIARRPNTRAIAMIQEHTLIEINSNLLSAPSNEFTYFCKVGIRPNFHTLELGVASSI